MACEKVETLSYATTHSAKKTAFLCSRGELILILVLADVIFLEILFVMRLDARGDACPRRFAQARVGANGTISQAIDVFELDVGRLPKSLDELFSFSSEDSDVNRWKGPYLCNPQGVIDPWGHAYHYDPTGKHSGGRYDLWSSGPNGVDDISDGDSNDGDDIRSWK